MIVFICLYEVAEDWEIWVIENRMVKYFLNMRWSQVKLTIILDIKWILFRIYFQNIYVLKIYSWRNLNRLTIYICLLKANFCCIIEKIKVSFQVFYETFRFLLDLDFYVYYLFENLLEHLIDVRLKIILKLQSYLNQFVPLVQFLLSIKNNLWNILM